MDDQISPSTNTPQNRLAGKPLQVHSPLHLSRLALYQQQSRYHLRPRQFKLWTVLRNV